MLEMQLVLQVLLQMQLVLQVLLQMQLVLLVHLMLQLVLQMLLQMQLVLLVQLMLQVQLVLLAPSPRVLVHLWLFPSPRVPHPLPFLQGFCTAPFFIAAFMPSKSCFFLFPPFPPHLWPPAPGG
jgi:hypothetical protein